MRRDLKLISRYLSHSMYIELSCIRKLYGKIICVYENSHVIITQVISKLEITKLFYIRNIMFQS